MKAHEIFESLMIYKVALFAMLSQQEQDVTTCVVVLVTKANKS